MPTFEDRCYVRMLVRTREAYQRLRKQVHNQIGIKADGTLQNVERPAIGATERILLLDVADNATDYESKLEKELQSALKRFPIYNEYLAGIKGVGPIAAGWIIGEYDIHKATTVSKLWQFTGLNPGLVRGQKRVEDGKGKFHYERIDKLIRGDKLTEGCVAPFNKKLRTALVGVMADGFIKQQNDYALLYYYPYKSRLEQEDNKIQGEDKAWSEASKGRRHRAAIRYMVKMFLKDLYVAWRTLEGLRVRPPYDEEYLGKVHERELIGV